MRRHTRALAARHGRSGDDVESGDARGLAGQQLARRGGHGSTSSTHTTSEKLGSNSSDAAQGEASQGDKGPQGDKAPQADKAPQQPVPANVTNQETPTDDVIPIKAGDMELDVSTHAKIRSSGEVFMFANSSLTTNMDLPSDMQSLSIFARGDKAGGEWPHLLVTVNGEVVGEVIVNSSVDKKFYVPVHVPPGAAAIGVAFVNDFSDPTTLEDRNVYLSKIKVHVQR
jgi:hypothetical protein